MVEESAGLATDGREVRTGNPTMCLPMETHSKPDPSRSSVAQDGQPERPAKLLEMSVPAANSALQRARSTLGKQVANREERTTSWQPTAEERRLLTRFMMATERADMTEMAELLKEDAVFWMPPDPGVFVGRDSIVESWTPALTGSARIGYFKMVPTRCNNQLAAANYVPAPGEESYERLSLDALRFEDGAIAEVITFPASVLDDFGLPERF